MQWTSLACLTKIYWHVVCEKECKHVHGIKQSSKALGQMAGNAMHLRAIAAALCCALKAGANLSQMHFTSQMLFLVACISTWRWLQTVDGNKPTGCQCTGCQPCWLPGVGSQYCSLPSSLLAMPPSWFPEITKNSISQRMASKHL